jgi:hypothetical protein
MKNSTYPHLKPHLSCTFCTQNTFPQPQPQANSCSKTHFSTTLSTSQNPNRSTKGKLHLRYRLQKSECNHPKGKYNLPLPISHFLPKSPHPKPIPSHLDSKPSTQPSPSKSLPISIVHTLPGVLSTPGNTSPAY